MATVRLVNSARILPFFGRGLISPIVVCRRSTTSTSGDFFAKNKALSRPVSPHLSILLKNPSPNAMLSIFHRITGVMLGLDISGTTIAYLASGKSFPQFIEGVQALSLSPLIVSGVKFGFAFPLSYHFFNAIRHLVWDMGYGFEIKDFSRTGYITLGVALLSAIGLTLYTPSS